MNYYEASHSSDPTKIRISVVIPSYNAQETLGEQLRSLTRQTYTLPFEIIISDNGSSDNTLQVASAFSDRLDMHVVDASETPGASFARNCGAQAARGPLLAFLDSDDIADEGWLQSFYEASESHPRSLLFGTLDYRKLNSASVQAAYGIPAESGLPTIPGLDATGPRAVDPARDSLPGANFALSKQAWDALQGMRADFPYGSEDADLGVRARQAGIAAFVVPNAVVYYRLRTTGADMFKQQRAWARSRAFLGAEHSDPLLGIPGVKSSVVKLLRSALTDIFYTIRSRDARRLLCNLGISVGRLQGAIQVRKYKRSGNMRERSSGVTHAGALRPGG